MPDRIPDWTIGGILLACMTMIWGAIRWFRGRVEGGYLSIVSQSGSSLQAEVARLKTDLALERERRKHAEQCAEDAIRDRDEAQERVIQIQQDWIDGLRRREEDDESDTDREGSGGPGDRPVGADPGAAAGRAGVLRRRGRSE